MANKPLAEVKHWYGKINVAVLKLNGTLKKGDIIRVQKGEVEFEETIKSMQINRVDVDKAKKGDDVAIQLSQKAKEGALVYKV